jgi:hypothetical protein
MKRDANKKGTVGQVPDAFGLERVKGIEPSS